MNGNNARRSGRLALFAAAAAVGLTACGGAKAPSVAKLGTTTASDAAATAKAAVDRSPGSPPSQAQQGNALKFSRCMRTHGVPNFPDPSPGGGFTFPAGSGFDPSSPAVRAAQATCRKYMPAPPGLAPGTVSHPTTQWLAHMLKVAECMRRHGVPNFPDPTTTIPALRPGIREISDIQGAIFAFPSSIDMRSPAVTRAANACNFPLHNH